MIWNLESWEHPCYNVNNGRCVSLFKWKNSKYLIYEETTNNIVPILSLKRPHSRALYISIISAFFVNLTCINYIIYILISNNLDIQKTHNNQNILLMILYSYIGGLISKIIFGFLNDRLGPRISYIILIIIISIGTLITYFSKINYYYIFVLNGFSWGGLILSDLWVITMFDINIIGITTGLLGCIYNLSYLFAFQFSRLVLHYIDLSNHIYFILSPNLIILLLIYPIYYFSDDCPYGNLNKLKKQYENSISENNQNTRDNSIHNSVISNENEITSVSSIEISNYSFDNNLNIENILSDINYSNKKCLKSLKNIKILSLLLTYLYASGTELSTFPNVIFKSENININLIFIYFITNSFGTILGGYSSDKNYVFFKIIGKIKIILIFTFLSIIISMIFNNYVDISLNKNISFKYLTITLMLRSFMNNLLQGAIISYIVHIDSNNIGMIYGVISSGGTLGGIIGIILYFNNNVYYTTRIINIFGGCTFVLNTLVLL